MPNKTIYVPEEELDTFKKAQQLAGESLSAVVIQALKHFIVSKETQDKDMKEIVLWRGTEEVSDTLRATGENVKFIGKLLGEETVEVYDGLTHIYKLYQTRKNKYLLYTISENKQTLEFKYSTRIIDTIKELYGSGVPSKLLAEAEKNMPEVPCVELDV